MPRMKTLHAFGCSISQGFALPDVVRPPLTDAEIQALDRPAHWSDEHILKASDYAWPTVLAHRLGINVANHARRGACFQQIARQCAVAAPTINPDDIVVVMWTYLSRLTMQWPARTAVPLTHFVDTDAPAAWHTRIFPGFNKLFGLSLSSASAKGTSIVSAVDDRLYNYIHNSTQYTFDPLGMYDRYHNSLVLQSMTDGFLRSTGATVIHLSVEPEPYLTQLERAALDLDPSLQAPWVIANPADWYSMNVDHNCCRVIHDPSIPPAANDMHPSVQHHHNFADHLYTQYFQS